jgi:flavin-binding protein dodecin
VLGSDSAPSISEAEAQTQRQTLDRIKPGLGLSSREETEMAESVYNVIELVGTSTDSWEKATSAAIERAAETLRDLRVAEIVEQDVTISDGKVESYRVKLKVSFKYEPGD